MRLAALAGVSRRRRPKTTVRDEEARPAPDLVERNFHVEAMDELWVALAKGLRGAAGATVLSHTYVPTATGFLYLAVVLDAFSRRVVGWAMETHLRAALVLQALDMAVKRRRPKGVIHHSDQGSQYTALDFGARRGKAGIRPSMGSVGDAYDNAMAESFFATLECELIDRRRFENPDHARREVFQFIEGWYNPRRRHSAIGYKSPINYERSIPPVAPIFDSPRKRGNSNFRFFRDHWNLPVSVFMMRPYQCRDRDGAHARRYAGASPVGISLGNRAVAYPSRSRDHVGQSPNRLWASNHGVRSPALGMQSSNGPSTGIPRSTADPGHQNSHPGRQRQF